MGSDSYREALIQEMVRIIGMIRPIGEPVRTFSSEEPPSDRTKENKALYLSAQVRRILDQVRGCKQRI